MYTVSTATSQIHSHLRKPSPLLPSPHYLATLLSFPAQANAFLTRASALAPPSAWKRMCPAGIHQPIHILQAFPSAPWGLPWSPSWILHTLQQSWFLLPCSAIFPFSITFQYIIWFTFITFITYCALSFSPIECWPQKVRKSCVFFIDGFTMLQI